MEEIKSFLVKAVGFAKKITPEDIRWYDNRLPLRLQIYYENVPSGFLGLFRKRRPFVHFPIKNLYYRFPTMERVINVSDEEVAITYNAKTKKISFNSPITVDSDKLARFLAFLNP